MNIEDIRLIHGDCLEVMDRLIEEGVKVDAIITDIPYGTTQCKWDSVLNLQVMWKHLKQLRKDKSPTILFGQTPFDKVLGSSNIKELKYEWIWEKTAATGHLNAKKMPMKAHENILVFYKKPPTYNPQKTFGHIRKTSKAEHKINCKESDVYNKGQKMTTYDSTERYPRSVIKFPSDKQTCNLHPTQKPLALMEYLVNTYTNKNDLVLDFTAGSFTTGVACKKLDRKFIGIELEKKYYDIGVERINNNTYSGQDECKPQDMVSKTQ